MSSGQFFWVGNARNGDDLHIVLQLIQALVNSIGFDYKRKMLIVFSVVTWTPCETNFWLSPVRIGPFFKFDDIHLANEL